MSDMEAMLSVFHPGHEGLGESFCSHLEVLFPRPRVLPLHDMCDVSSGAVTRRKARFWGHVKGYHPALVWHLKMFIAGATKEAGKP